jgi:hypothetical protein
MKSFHTVIILQLLVLLATGCSRNPQARREEFVQSGNRYFDQGKYAEAIRNG